MTEDYARTLKRRTLVALVATLISLVLLGAAMFWMWCKLFGPPEFMRKDNPSLSPQSAQSQLDAGATVYWQDTAYQVPAHSGLSELLHTDQWTSTSAFQTENAELVMHFGELTSGSSMNFPSGRTARPPSMTATPATAPKAMPITPSPPAW